jgi:serine protease Do
MLNRWTIFAAVVCLIPLSPVVPHLVHMMSSGRVESIRGQLPSVVNVNSFVADTSATTPMNAGTVTADQHQSLPKSLKGSGFIIDPSGVILTNYHVVDGAYDIQVTFSDGERVPGRILAAAPIVDLALVKVTAKQLLSAVRWADSDKVQVADPVFAAGNPLGIGLSVSSGIVSALNRNISSGPYDDFIQTDAAINHGNSGGPLFNRNGDVIGVDTAIISPTTGSVGLGFAIPANDARFIADRLLHDGSIRFAYLGIKVEQVTHDVAAALGLPRPMGSIVSAVNSDGPAASAGLRVGDVILHYDNQTPSDDRALLRAIARSTVGRAVPVTILRAGREQTIQVNPGESPETITTAGAVSGQASSPATLVPANLGLSLSTLTADERSRYGLQMQQAGVLVAGVDSHTDAFDRGLAPGDVILRMQGTDVHSPQEEQAAVDAARAQHKAFVRRSSWPWCWRRRSRILSPAGSRSKSRIEPCFMPAMS